MKGMRRAQGFGSLTSTASSTATLFAAGGTGTRWHLQKGYVGVIGPAANATLTIQETYSAGTAGNVIMKVPLSTNNDVILDFGDAGFQASATNSRLAWLVGGANASINGMFVGYYR